MSTDENEIKRLENKLVPILRNRIRVLKKHNPNTSALTRIYREKTLHLKKLVDIKRRRNKLVDRLNSLGSHETISSEDLDLYEKLQKRQLKIMDHYIMFLEVNTPKIEKRLKMRLSYLEELSLIAEAETAIYKRIIEIGAYRLTKKQVQYAKISGASAIISVKLEDAEEAVRQLKAHSAKLKEELKHLRRRAKVVISGLEFTPEEKRMARLMLKRKGDDKKEIVHECPPGSYWSPTKNACFYPYEYPCPEGHYYSPIKGECVPIEPSVSNPQVTPSTTGDKKDTPQKGKPVKRWIPEGKCPEGWTLDLKYGICVPGGWNVIDWINYLKKNNKWPDK